MDDKKIDEKAFLDLIEYTVKAINDIINNIKPIRPIDAVIWGKPWMIKLWIPKKEIKDNVIVRIKFLVLIFPIEKYIINPINGMVNKLSKWRPVANPIM